MPTDHGVQVPEIEGGSVRQPNVAPGGTPVAVRSFEFAGNTKVPTADLQARVAASVGKSLTLAELYDLAMDLTRFYQSRGYPLASINVPAQKIEDGIVHLQVIEGRIGKVRVEGAHYYQKDVLDAQLRELASGDVITSATLERELLLLNDLPGLTARLVVVSGEQPFTSDLVVKVEEKPVSFSASADNYGRVQIGEARLSGHVGFDALGRGDQITIDATHSQGGLLDYFRGGYSLPIGSDGGRLGLSYYTTSYKVNDPLVAVLDLTGVSNSYAAEYTYPLVRTRASNQVLSVSLSTSKSSTENFGISTSSSDVTLLAISLLGSDVFADGSSREYSLGFSGNGKNNSGNNPHDQCCKLSGELGYTMPISADWWSHSRVRAAWSPDAVADIEKFSIGGPSSVRGYASSEVRGDNGVEGSLELHRALTMLPAKSDVSFFLDGGYVSSKPSPSTPRVSGPTIASVGTALTMHDLYGFDCNIEWARPISGLTARDTRVSRLWLSISTHF